MFFLCNKRDEINDMEELKKNKRRRRQTESGDRSMVRCGTLKEAELIPDSAVPYTLPESRWNSSNRQIVIRVERSCLHTLRHVWGNGALITPKEKVLERTNHSWLVREKELAAQLLVCVWVCVFKCVWLCVRSVLLFQATGREGTEKAVDAKNAASRLAAKRWQSNPTGRRSVWDHTQSQVWHAVRCFTHSACQCLCFSVDILRLIPYFYLKPMKTVWSTNVFVWVLKRANTICFGRIR